MFPYRIKNIEGNDGKELLELFKGQKAGFVQVGPKRWTLPAKYADHAEKYYTFDLKGDDLWVMSFPRSGSTWLQELLWLVNNKLDYEISSKIPLYERFPFFEFNLLLSDKYLEEIAELNDNDQEVIKELKHFDMPEVEVMVVVVGSAELENIRDLFHYRGCFTALSSTGTNLQVQTDLHGNIRKICTFLNKQMTDDEIKRLADHLHIDNFRKNFTFTNKRSKIKGMINLDAQGFIRRGKIGSNEEFDDDEIKLRAEKWFKKNLAKTDIVFPEF